MPEGRGSSLALTRAVMEDAALVVGVVQLGAVGAHTVASPKKNCRGGQHAYRRCEEINPEGVLHPGASAEYFDIDGHTPNPGR